MAFNAAFSSPYSINVLKGIEAENLSILHQWLPTLVINLERTITDLHERKIQIFKHKRQITELQKSSQLGENIESIIETGIKALTLSFSSTCDELLHLINYGQQLQTAMNPGKQYQTWDPAISFKLKGVFTNLFHLWQELVANSLLVSVQPGPIIQKDKSIETEVRFLVNAAFASPKVQCQIVNISDAESLQSGKMHCTHLSSQGVIDNNETPLVAKDGALVSKHYEEKDKHMVLKNIGRRKKANAKDRTLVTELQCVILYQIAPTEALSQVLLGYTDTIWAVSLPIVLITHGKQMIDALCTIVWNREFGNAREMEWSKLAEVLKKTFAHVTGSTKRMLTDSDLDYLRSKLNGNGKSILFTYEQFAKDKIGPEGKFTFWTYFYSICDVIAKKLLQYWNKGFILGLSHKDDASKKLCEFGKPAFLLRFSDSQLSSVAVIYIKNNTNGVKQFLLPAIQPEKAHTLVELLRGFNQLQYIRYLVNKNYELLDKGLFFDDKDLTVGSPADEKITKNGYHKISLAFTLDDPDEDDVESNFYEPHDTPQSNSQTDQIYASQPQSASSSLNYNSPNSTSLPWSPAENSLNSVSPKTSSCSMVTVTDVNGLGTSNHPQFDFGVTDFGLPSERTPQSFTDSLDSIPFADEFIDDLVNNRQSYESQFPAFEQLSQSDSRIFNEKDLDELLELTLSELSNTAHIDCKCRR